MHVILAPSRLRRWLFRTVAVIAVLGVLAETAYYQLEFESNEYLMEVFSLSLEHNFPTWFSATLHGLCAGLLVLAAVGARQAGTRYARHWVFLAFAFAYISLDETVTIHEKLNRLVDVGDGVLHYGWIVPAAGVLLVLGVAYAGFLLHLPPRTRRDVLLAGTLFVSGAVLMEMPLGVWSSAHGVDNLGYALIDAVEETLEMLGVSLFLVALVRHLVGHESGLHLRLAGGELAREGESGLVDPVTGRSPGTGPREGAFALEPLSGATQGDEPQHLAGGPQPTWPERAQRLAASLQTLSGTPGAGQPVSAEVNAWTAPSPPAELVVPARKAGRDEHAPAAPASIAARVVAASLGGFPRPRSTPGA